MTGRQTAWCSLSCKRLHDTETKLIDNVDTYVRTCKVCKIQKVLAADFYPTTPAGTYRRECRACTMAGNTARDLKPDAADKKRNVHLVGLYGITTEQYEQLLQIQGGRCAVCGKPPIRKRLSVDHDHTTGLIRGLLCNYCNLRIVGKATDAKLYYAAANYLENPPARALLPDHTVPRRVPPSRRRKRPRKKAA